MGLCYFVQIRVICRILSFLLLEFVILYPPILLIQLCSVVYVQQWSMPPLVTFEAKVLICKDFGILQSIPHLLYSILTKHKNSNPPENLIVLLIINLRQTIPHKPLQLRYRVQYFNHIFLKSFDLVHMQQCCPSAIFCYLCYCVFRFPNLYNVNGMHMLHDFIPNTFCIMCMNCLLGRY